jgi:rhomboid family GlyGly-CTERM serine protease
MSSRTAESEWDLGANSIADERLTLARLPMVTFAVALAALMIAVSPAGGESLSYDRGAIACGELWRWITGHLAHWNADHLAWDVVVFAALGTVVERFSRRAFVATLLLAVLAISASTWVCQPDVAKYRGLSGVDSALFAFAAAMLLRDARREGRSAVVTGIAALAAAFVAKIGWEIATGQTLFVDSTAAGFTPLPLVHAVGGVVGAAVWFGHSLGRSSRTN